jgi:hypothetical protein
MAEDFAYAEQFRRAIENFWLVRARQGVKAGQHLDKWLACLNALTLDEVGALFLGQGYPRLLFVIG